MKIIHILVILLYVISLISGCNRLKNNDQKRINELNEMTVLWESSILVANPSIPGMTVLISMYDSYDANLIEHMTDTAEKTPDYIPEEVRAYAANV